MNQFFSTNTMYEIGEGNELKVHFDFSKIEFNIYNEFFNTLPNFLLKKIKSVLFSNNFLKNNNENNLIIQNSIFLNKKKYLQYLIKILSRILPQTNNLESLNFSNLNIPKQEFNVLINSIGSSKSLNSLSFNNIEISNENFNNLLNLISPYQYIELNFNNCNLNNSNFNLIKNFITLKPITSKQIYRKIKYFNIENNSFNNEQLKIISNLIEEAKNDEINTYSDSEIIIEEIKNNKIISPIKPLFMLKNKINK